MQHNKRADIFNLALPSLPPPSDLPFPVVHLPAPPPTTASYDPTVIVDHSSSLPPPPPPPPELENSTLLQDHHWSRGAAAAGSSRGFRHMMHERERRERLSQGYADLHAMLSLRSKGDKVSIVEAATKCVNELKQAEKKLLRRNQELQMMATRKASTIRWQMKNSTSPIVDAISALQCLKHMNLRPETIQINFSGLGDFSVETSVQTHVIEH